MFSSASGWAGRLGLGWPSISNAAEALLPRSGNGKTSAEFAVTGLSRSRFRTSV